MKAFLMKVFYKLSFIFIFIFLLSNNLINYNNGDPFDYISSDIVLIKDASIFIEKVNQIDKIIIVFVYLNHLYGDLHPDFSHMAMIYNELKKTFASNKNIEFYRVHMCRGVSPVLLEPVVPSMQIYMKGEKIKSIHGKKEKFFLIKTIIDSIKNNLNKFLGHSQEDY